MSGGAKGHTADHVRRTTTRRADRPAAKASSSAGKRGFWSIWRSRMCAVWCARAAAREASVHEVARSRAIFFGARLPKSGILH